MRPTLRHYEALPLLLLLAAPGSLLLLATGGIPRILFWPWVMTILMLLLGALQDLRALWRRFALGQPAWHPIPKATVATRFAQAWEIASTTFLAPNLLGLFLVNFLFALFPSDSLADRFADLRLDRWTWSIATPVRTLKSPDGATYRLYEGSLNGHLERQEPNGRHGWSRVVTLSFHHPPLPPDLRIDPHGNACVYGNQFELVAPAGHILERLPRSPDPPAGSPRPGRTRP